MNESLAAVKELIEECSEEDRKALRTYLLKLSPHPIEHEWGIDADTILSAISRSSDLTKRGVRGIIAEAIFVNEVVPTVRRAGWLPVEFEGNNPYDALLQNDDNKVRIQVKLQRLEEGKPKHFYPKYYEAGTLFVVEVQKTRTGERPSRGSVPVSNLSSAKTKLIKVMTRPYTFGDFDILAVNMHPSCGNWREFRYTVASWLMPRSADKNLIEIFQPVAAKPNDVWTDSLTTCLDWFVSGKERRVLTDILHPRSFKRVGKGKR